MLLVMLPVVAVCFSAMSATTATAPPPDLRARRIALGLSLTAAARRLGISHSHLSNVEAGRRGLSPARALAHRELLASAPHRG